MYVSEGKNYTSPSEAVYRDAHDEIKAKLKMADALMEEAADIADLYGIEFWLETPGGATVYYEGKGTVEGGDRHDYNPEWSNSGYGWYYS